MIKKKILLLFVLFLMLFSFCFATGKKDGLLVPTWSNNATMYEVNIRQYSEEGSFKAFQEHLPRLKKMGIKILWFMPIYPISQEKRLGTLGSYYSIADYTEINPEFGNKEDFKELVDACHKMGFKVILDWVANHTGWDHKWVSEHPDWYKKNAMGEIMYPESWQDVAALDFSHPSVNEEMANAMLYWVKNFDIDGYRCDFATGVPVSFWNSTRDLLNTVKPVFMLAEDNKSKAFLMHAFNANYGWDLYHTLNSIGMGAKKADSLNNYFEYTIPGYPKGSYPLHFIDNHDENSWNGTVNERLGEAQKAMLALIFTSPGMPLVYSGQEVNLDWRLEFFEKDCIKWDNFVNEALLTKLIHLKLQNPALWNGNSGGELKLIETNNSNLLLYSREKGNNKVFVFLNLSSKEQSFNISLDKKFTGKELINETKTTLSQGENQLTLAAWDFLIISNK